MLFFPHNWGKVVLREKKRVDGFRCWTCFMPVSCFFWVWEGEASWWSHEKNHHHENIINHHHESIMLILSPASKWTAGTLRNHPKKFKATNHLYFVSKPPKFFTASKSFASRTRCFRFVKTVGGFATWMSWDASYIESKVSRYVGYNPNIHHLQAGLTKKKIGS